MKKISLRDFSIMVAFLFVLICNAVFATEKPVVWADDIDYTNDHVYYKNLETGEAVEYPGLILFDMLGNWMIL